MKHQIFILLGTNLGDRLANLASAATGLRFIGEILRTSDIYETAAWGVTNQDKFLNQVIELGYEGKPEELLVQLQKIEFNLGRTRTIKWGPRLIDLDILFFDDLVIQSADLQIPHPGIPDRRFTLLPLVQLAPELLHPVIGQTLQELLSQCKDPLEVKLYF